MTRQERIALHKKQERLQVQKNAPSVAELSEGVPTLRSTPEGLVEYVRYNNQLYKKVYVPESTAGTAKNPAFHVELEDRESIAAATEEKVPFDTIIFDTNSGFNNTASGTNPYSYTIGKGGAGLYHIAATITIDDISDSGDDGENVELFIVHNASGTDVHYEQSIYQISGDSFAWGMTTSSVIIDAKEGDYAYIAVKSTESATIDDNYSSTRKWTWFEGFKIN